MILPILYISLELALTQVNLILQPMFVSFASCYHLFASNLTCPAPFFTYLICYLYLLNLMICLLSLMNAFKINQVPYLSPLLIVCVHVCMNFNAYDVFC